MRKLKITNMLSKLAAAGAIAFAAYHRAIQSAQQSTEGKGMDCTKSAYAFGIECYANLSAFIELIETEAVIQKGGYDPEYHFHYVTKLFAKIAGITVTGGEVSRIALVCKYLHKNNIAHNNLSAWFEQVGGLRKAYNLTVAVRNGGAANDNLQVDETLVLQVWNSKGFLGILNIDVNKANKLFSQNGLKVVAANDNTANDNIVINKIERNADNA